jgi:membrane-associated HD superfamily phosphohydrolase
MAKADLVSLSSLSVGCFVGAYVVRGIRRRIDFARAGLMTGLAQAATLFSGYLLLQGPIDEAVARCVASFMGGSFFSALLTFCLLPFCESVFGLITDVSLLELSDLNHPLLKELSVKAPGTYHHSLLVAHLAEAACEAIGANSLLARVGCYFHDVGKMLHP